MKAKTCRGGWEKEEGRKMVEGMRRGSTREKADQLRGWGWEKDITTQREGVKTEV